MSPTSDERGLARALLARAEEDRRRILEQARGEARAILAEADRQAQALREERIRLAEDRARRELSLEISRARFEQVAVQTRLLDAAVGRALGEARVRLAELRKEPGYPALLSRLARECLLDFPGGVSVRLRVDPRDRSLLESLGLPAQAEAGGRFLGGVQAVDGRGELLVDNTFEARLDASASELRLRLGAIFSGERE